MWRCGSPNFPMVPLLAQVQIQVAGEDKAVRSNYGITPVHIAVIKCHLPAVVQYLCEQGADKEARDTADRTSLHLEARGFTTSLWCSIYVCRGLIRRRGVMVTRHHCTKQLAQVTSLRYSPCARRELTRTRRWCWQDNTELGSRERPYYL